MGNYRFKLSDMLPNAWFYKLNHMNSGLTKTKKVKNSMHGSSNKSVQSKAMLSRFSSSSTATAPPQLCHRRSSYYFNREFDVQPNAYNNSSSGLSEPPRKSSRKRRSSIKKARASSRQIVKSSASHEYFSRGVGHERICTEASYYSEMYPSYSPDGSSCDDPCFSDLDSDFERVKVDAPSNHFHCRIPNNNSISQKIENCRRFDSQLQLKPIITKLDQGDHKTITAVKFRGNSVKADEESSFNVKNYSIKEAKKGPVVKMTVNSPGVKVRANYSPRMGPKRVIQVQGRKSVSSEKIQRRNSVSSRLNSVAIVKETRDPDRDFKESMVEMIMEHNMRTKEDYEQLLACYLSLNSGFYHNLIINVFEQIWFEMTGN